MAVTRQALPRGAATVRAQVRDTRVPLLEYTDTGAAVYIAMVGGRRDGRVARRGKFLEMPWLAFPEAPLTGALSPWLEYFVLEWFQRNHGGPWRSPGKPCHGVLRLPVHKFGILGYPYSSTPTGAPGPGPHMAPSAVGPGPKQGTGTRALGYAVSYSVSTAPSPNGTRRMRRRGRDRGWFFIRKSGTSAPSLFISR